MTTDIERHAPAAPVPARVGQATAVEQSRAMAEVQAAVVVAQQCPRDEQRALQQMRDSCRQQRLAERAFFRFNRGGGNVTGPTVHLARELARVWGNIQYGINELARDDAHGQSEMQAWAWDLQTNTRSSQTFIVPHARDKKGGPERLVDLRDIYENNTNQGARRLRQAIWAVLPPWLVDEAVELCNTTLRNGGGVPLPQRIAGALDRFASRGVSRDRIERRVGRPSAQWNEHDVAELGVVWKSIDRGETRIEDEFPAERTTAAEITAQAADVQAAAQPVTSNPASKSGGKTGGKKPAGATEAAYAQDHPQPSDDELGEPPADWQPAGHPDGAQVDVEDPPGGAA